MSLGVRGGFSESDMTPAPTDAQLNYVELLMEWLDERGHPDIEDYGYRAENCEDIGEMSELIDEMKTELEEWS